MNAPAGPKWRIDDVLDRTNLTSLLDDLADPANARMRVRRWHCPMPDHDDQRASVSIYTDHRGHERWRCWSGDDTHRGDAVDLVAATQRMSKADAIDWLARRAGMVPDQVVAPVERPARVAVPEGHEVPLDPLVVRYVEACERILWGPTGRPVREWLHGRGFDDDLLRVNRVGCDPGRAMMRRQQGLPYGRSLAAVFPALNEQGEIHYAQTRYLDPGNGPKYENPAAHLGTNPRLAWARTVGEPRSSILVVCEGIPDALTAASLRHQSVGVLGAHADHPTLGAEIAAVSKRLDLAIFLVNDHDDAGRSWSARIALGLNAAGVASARLEPRAPRTDLNDAISLGLDTDLIDRLLDGS